MTTKHTQRTLSTSNKTWSKISLLFVVATLLATSMFISSCGDDEDPKAPELKITSISPTTGGAGTEVTIVGTGFSATSSQNAVTLNSKVCPVTSATTTQLKVTIPANAGSGNLSVTVAGKTVQSSAFTFIDEVPLAITSIAPTTGPKATVVTITGTGFSSTPTNNSVSINGKPCTINTSTATQLVVVIPASAGSGSIRVVVDGSTVESSSFNYVYTATVTTFAGSSNAYAEGTGTAAQFGSPLSVTTDGTGNVYVSDHGNFKIRKITPAGVTSLLAGSTQGDVLGAGDGAQFNYAYYVAADATGNIFTVDTHNHKIKKINSNGVVTLFAGSTGGGANGSGDAAQFYYPTGIAVATDGTVYIADKDNHTIRKITAEGVVSTLAGTAGQSGYVDATGAEARFNGPYDLTVAADGNIFVADASNHKIRKVTPAGVVTTIAGSTGGFLDGAASQAQFNYPYSVVAGANNILYVVDTHNHKIRKIAADGTVSTFVGTTEGNDDGNSATAKFRYPTDMVIDNNGNFYIADKDNHRIRKVVLD